MTTIEKLTIMVIASLFILQYVSNAHIRKEFVKACDKAGGETIWDGRQYQCISTKERK